MQFLEKLWNMQENLAILSLSQQKEEEPSWCQKQIIIPQSFSQKISQPQKFKKIEILMYKPVYLRLSILELSKALMYEFWYDYEKPNIVKMLNFVIWMQKALSFL